MAGDVARVVKVRARAMARVVARVKVRSTARQLHAHDVIMMM